MSLPDWSYEDPRVVLMGRKRARIVIVRPSPDGGPAAGCGFCEMNHGWLISTPFENHETIGAEDDWDPAWCWTLAPGDGV